LKNKQKFKATTTPLNLFVSVKTRHLQVGQFIEREKDWSGKTQNNLRLNYPGSPGSAISSFLYFQNPAMTF
jgi:hypothetical protein